MTEMQFAAIASVTRLSCWFRAAALVAGLGAAATAGAQSLPAGPRLGANAFGSPDSLVSIDLGKGAGFQRHRALRIRFDGAAQALRRMGMETDSCSTLLRSRRSGEGLSHMGLTVSLNCRFF